MSSTAASEIIKIQQIMYGYDKSIDELVKVLESDLVNGLDNDNIHLKQNLLGPNKIKTIKPSIWKAYLAPLFDVLITVYLIMTVLMIFLAIWVDGVASSITIWIVMISFNMVLAIWQQFRAQKKIESLTKLSPPSARVIRNGHTTTVLAESLVPGDIIKLSLGDKIPADARIIESSNLTVNEASLTGESIPVEKNRDGRRALDENTPISQRDNMIYLGTFIQTGSARALVTKIGNYTELGKIANAMSEMQTMEIPLRNRVNSLGKKLVIVMLSFLALKIGISMNNLIQEDNFGFDEFINDLALSILIAMSVMPINIPLLTTVILISGVLNMATKNVVVKQLSVIETLGRCSVLCSDKTGTMTTSRMTAKLIWDTNSYFGISLDEFYNNILFKLKEHEVHDFLATSETDKEGLSEIYSGSTLELVLTSAILNNDANLIFKDTETKSKLGNEESRSYRVIGNPTDGALLTLALSHGFRQEAVKARYQNYRNYPFDPSIKLMSGLFRDIEEDDYMVLTKGASERILPLCRYIGDERNIRPLTKDERDKIANTINEFAEAGYRVISLAYRSIKEFPGTFTTLEQERDFIENELTYIGFAVIHDPPRPGVKKAVAELDDAGIFPVMITGDSPATAATIARQVGILDPDEIVIEGSKVSLLSDEDFFKVSVFARVSPQDKEVIVKRYQQKGGVVAMTGDGVNDALAITRSDAGIAMGLTGTEVTKESADLIISDDSYVSLVEGVREGRNLYEQIRIMIFFYLAVNIGEGMIYFFTSFDDGFYLVSTWQRIYIFSIIHAFPVLAIIFGPPDDNIMKLQPRKQDSLMPKQLAIAM
ncbi:MAG: cation-transporting P-type ATPase, partial [Candidatus Heimdallarchaeota archaeon]|nr:cation-transporting P-type ATPase [Candidatus Heimdallarchaeota archaeon]